MCDHCSMVDRATCLIARATGVTLEGGMRFSSEIVVVADTFTPSQVLNFVSLEYVTDYNDEFHP
jgi:hypothetical protein